MGREAHIVNVNGQVAEALLDKKELVCVNDGRGTGVHISKGWKSALDWLANVTRRYEKSLALAVQSQSQKVEGK